jgi:NAD(P)-dependent dehydrogenase (short-subunit alcohol dehydrogenase family)
MSSMRDTSMQGRTCLITGASSGIGQATAAALAARGAHVVMAGRDPARTEAARKDVVERSGSDRVEVVLADLASLADVHELAGEVRSRFERLHVLINNAGIVTAERQLTSDGFETMFGVNHLAHYLLTLELLPLLKASTPARIVVVASDATCSPSAASASPPSRGPCGSMGAPSSQTCSSLRRSRDDSREVASP